MEIQSFYVFQLRSCPVLYKGIALPIKQSFLCLCCPAFSWIFTNINASVVIVNSQVCVPEVHLYQMNLAVRRARCNDPCYYSFICPSRSRVLPLPSWGAPALKLWLPGLHQQSKVHRLRPFFSVLDWPSLSPLLTSWIELVPTAKPGWNRSESLQRKINTRESYVSIRRQTNRQARGDGSRKELAGVGPGKMLLLFSCSAAPDGWAHPACCILVYHSGHRLAAQEGGRPMCQG